MGRSEERLTTREVVLLIVAAAGGTVEGRTVMQKLAYFSGLALDRSLGHQPHYYGPFSSKVEDALTIATAAGELRETVERMPGWSGDGPDIIKYTYELTDQGQEKVSVLQRDHREGWTKVHAAVNAISEVLPDLNQMMLSSAAKTYLIVDESGTDVDVEEIPKLAKRLGWKLTPSQVNRTLDILRRLNLLQVQDTPASSR
jgi:uncharacterized protein YwgA